MSRRDTIELVLRQMYEARKAGDVQAILHHCAPEMSWELVSAHPENPVGHVVVGHEAIGREMTNLSQAFVFEDVRLAELIVEGDKAAAQWRLRVRSPATGKSVDTELADFVTFSGEKVVAFRQYCDSAVAGWLLQNGASG